MSTNKEQEENIVVDKKPSLNLVIDEGCIETDPCYHAVTWNGREGELDGWQIYKLHVKYNLPVPEHFKQYENYEEHMDIISKLFAD